VIDDGASPHTPPPVIHDSPGSWRLSPYAKPLYDTGDSDRRVYSPGPDWFRQPDGVSRVKKLGRIVLQIGFSQVAAGKRAAVA